MNIQRIQRLFILTDIYILCLSSNTCPTNEDGKRLCLCISPNSRPAKIRYNGTKDATIEITINELAAR